MAEGMDGVVIMKEYWNTLIQRSNEDNIWARNVGGHVQEEDRAHKLLKRLHSPLHCPHLLCPFIR